MIWYSPLKMVMSQHEHHRKTISKGICCDKYVVVEMSNDDYSENLWFFWWLFLWNWLSFWLLLILIPEQHFSKDLFLITVTSFRTETGLPISGPFNRKLTRHRMRQQTSAQSSLGITWLCWQNVPSPEKANTELLNQFPVFLPELKFLHEMFSIHLCNTIPVS